jgi:ATP-binding cassette subfamily B protein
VASVEDADLILVLDNGKITAAGTHENLLRESEIYREIHEQQTRGGAQDE